MNREDIIRMAWEAASVYSHTTEFYSLSPNQLQHFAALVAAAQKEACAKVCDRFAEREMHPAECADAIRAMEVV